MKYGPNFVQHLDEQVLETLSPVARYVGHAVDLQHLRGIKIATRDVERLVYVGERENVEVEDLDGVPQCPWKHVYIVELDQDGQPVVDGYVNAPPLPTFGPRAMSRADLASLGFTDAELDVLAREVLGERWQPDRPGLSDARRAMFDRVMAVLFG